MPENSVETVDSKQPAPTAELCKCEFWGGLRPLAKSCGHIKMGPTGGERFMVTIEDAEAFVEKLNEVIRIAKQLRDERQAPR